MKKEYLDGLIREIGKIDSRIESKSIQEGKGVTFLGPNGKFLKIEDKNGDRFAGCYYTQEGQGSVLDKGVTRNLDRKPGKLNVESFQLSVGDAIEDVVVSARKAFELLLERK
jgi:hypothetical protein